MMKQECKLVMIWFTWLGLPALAIIMGIMQGWLAAVFILIIGVFAQVIYIKVFPKISGWLGYGSVEDVAADSAQKIKVSSKVMLYTANVCPFCPIVKQRLIELQRNLEFQLEEVDITFKPNLIKEKGFRSVPVIEKDGKYLIGNATSAQLIAFLTK
jgi:glutaredoxin